MYAFLSDIVKIFLLSHGQNISLKNWYILNIFLHNKYTTGVLSSGRKDTKTGKPTFRKMTPPIPDNCSKNSACLNKVKSTLWRNWGEILKCLQLFREKSGGCREGLEARFRKKEKKKEKDYWWRISSENKHFINIHEFLFAGIPS